VSNTRVGINAAKPAGAARGSVGGGVVGTATPSSTATMVIAAFAPTPDVRPSTDKVWGPGARSKGRPIPPSRSPSSSARVTPNTRGSDWMTNTIVSSGVKPRTVNGID
jgi:hypothetical protein